MKRRLSQPCLLFQGFTILNIGLNSASTAANSLNFMAFPLILSCHRERIL